MFSFQTLTILKITRVGGLDVMTSAPLQTWKDTSPGTWTATGTDSRTGLENLTLKMKFYLIHCKTIVKPCPQTLSPKGPNSDVTSATLRACLGVIPVLFLVCGRTSGKWKVYATFAGVLPQKWYSASVSTPILN